MKGLLFLKGTDKDVNTPGYRLQYYQKNHHYSKGASHMSITLFPHTLCFSQIVILLHFTGENTEFAIKSPNVNH